MPSRWERKVVSTTADPRPDRSAAVKEAILISARKLFTENGFEATGIREIAAAADVNPAIVIRHYGSKERLFVQAIDGEASWLGLLDGPVEGLGNRVVRSVVAGRRGALEVFGASVRASGWTDIHDHLQRSIDEEFARQLSALIDAPDAQLRAHLFAAQVVGLMSALSVYHDSILLDADAEAVVSLYGASLQGLVHPKTAV